MSSVTRKNKRRVAFRCAKQGISPAQAIAESAAREIKVTKEAAAECRAMRNERIREWKHNKCWPKG